MGDPSKPLPVSGRKVCVEVVSTVELISIVSLSARTDSIVGVEVMLSWCDEKEEGRISPCALISVVGETGAGVLNSKAR